MKVWNLIPVLRLLLPFMGGVLLQLFYPLQFDFLFSLLIVSIVLGSISLFFRTTIQQWKYRWWAGICIHLVFFFLGGMRCYLEKEINAVSHFQNQNKHRAPVNVRGGRDN